MVPMRADVGCALLQYFYSRVFDLSWVVRPRPSHPAVALLVRRMAAARWLCCVQREPVLPGNGPHCRVPARVIAAAGPLHRLSVSFIPRLATHWFMWERVSCGESPMQR